MLFNDVFSFKRQGCEGIVRLVTSYLEKEEIERRSAAAGGTQQTRRAEKKVEKEKKRLDRVTKREEKLRK